MSYNAYKLFIWSVLSVPECLSAPLLLKPEPYVAICHTPLLIETCKGNRFIALILAEVPAIHRHYVPRIT